MTKIGQPRRFKFVAGFAVTLDLAMSAMPTLAYAGMAKPVVSDKLVSALIERSLPIALVMSGALLGAIWLGPRQRPNAATNLLGVALVVSAVGMVYGLR